MTVAQLLQALVGAPSYARVCISYDSGYAYTDAKSVEINLDTETVWIEAEAEEIMKLPVASVETKEQARLTAEEVNAANKALIDSIWGI